MSDMSDVPDELNEFSTAAMVLRDRPPPRLARAVTLTLCAFAAVAIAYAWLASVDVVVTAPGRVVPAGRTIVVQSAEAGFVKNVLVQDGQRVKAGEPVMVLARAAVPTAGTPSASGSVAGGTANNQAWLDARLLESLSKLATLDAEVARRRADRDSAIGVLQQLEASGKLVGKKHDMRVRLARSGHMTETNVIETKLEVINLEKEIAVQRNRIQEAEAALTAAVQQRTQAETEYKARFPIELAEVARRAAPAAPAANGEQALAAPADGIVHWVSSSPVGTAVGPAQNLFVVVPEANPLEVEVLVFNKDIGHLKPGQPAIVKVETYDYTRYGHIGGTVQWTGADAVTDPKLGPVFATRLSLATFETPNTVNGLRGYLAPGMNVTVDVRVAERRVIEYFLSPLLRYKEESLRER